MNRSPGTGRSRLRIYLPGLLGGHTWHAAANRLPALNWLIAKADRVAVTDVNNERVLRFFYAAAPRLDLCWAALTAVYDFGESSKDVWMRADPVYLQPDGDTLVLFDASSFELDKADAQQLIADVNRQLVHRSLTLMAGKSPSRWYLRLQTPPAITTSALPHVVGRSTLEYLPVGVDAEHWLQVTNEIQMLLHGSPTNQAREERGAVPINSVWCWGCGRLPPPVDTSPGMVWSNDALTNGLAQYAGCALRPYPDGARELDVCAASDHLVVIDTLLAAVQSGDEERWHMALSGLEQAWFAPLRKMLKAGRFSTLELCTEQIDLRLPSAARWRFWRRRGLA